MKILKRPDHIVFDTENPTEMEFNPIPKHLPCPIHLIIAKTTYDYLKEHFKPRENITHPIFRDFGDSYYFCVGV